MTHKISLVPEGLVARRTVVDFLAWLDGNVTGIVVNVLVALEQLLLAESEFAVWALEWLLIRVNQHV